MVLRYGGYVSVMTGLSMLTANVIYGTLRNPEQLAIPFEDGRMMFHWGWCFWLSIVTGNLYVSDPAWCHCFCQSVCQSLWLPQCLSFCLHEDLDAQSHRQEAACLSLYKFLICLCIMFICMTVLLSVERKDHTDRGMEVENEKRSWIVCRWRKEIRLWLKSRQESRRRQTDSNETENKLTKIEMRYERKKEKR